MPRCRPPVSSIPVPRAAPFPPSLLPLHPSPFTQPPPRPPTPPSPAPPPFTLHSSLFPLHPLPNHPPDRPPLPLLLRHPRLLQDLRRVLPRLRRPSAHADIRRRDPERRPHRLVRPVLVLHPLEQ